MVKKKNPESVALSDSIVEFIAPASFYQEMPPYKPVKETTDKAHSERPTQTSKPEIVQETTSETLKTSVPSSEEPISKPTVPTESLQNISTEPASIHTESKIEATTSEIIGDTAAEVATRLVEQEVLVSETPEKEEPLVEEKAVETQKINISSLAEKRVSALSISSLKAKKVHEQNRKDDSIDESELPKEAFTEETMQSHWADFVQKLDDAGRKILASNLNADVPKLRNETTIWIELPNGTMKKEIEREQYDLMEYLKSKLNNHFVSLQISVNEATAKKFAFTPEEKYQKLREKNPTIDLLRKEFDLDL